MCRKRNHRVLIHNLFFFSEHFKSLEKHPLRKRDVGYFWVLCNGKSVPNKLKGVKENPMPTLSKSHKCNNVFDFNVSVVVMSTKLDECSIIGIKFCFLFLSLIIYCFMAMNVHFVPWYWVSTIGFGGYWCISARTHHFLMIRLLDT